MNFGDPPVLFGVAQLDFIYILRISDRFGDCFYLRTTAAYAAVENLSTTFSEMKDHLRLGGRECVVAWSGNCWAIKLAFQSSRADDV